MARSAHTLYRLRSARRWITALALLAFFLQGLAVQTHVHQLLPAAIAKMHTDGTHKGPLKLDPIDQCRLCQELHHAGRFITPSLPVSIANLTIVQASFALLLVIATDPASTFAWQSRAPPHG